MIQGKEVSLGSALKDYFGYKPGEGASDFMKELKALTPEDRTEFKDLLTKSGYNIAVQ